MTYKKIGATHFRDVEADFETLNTSKESKLVRKYTPGDIMKVLSIMAPVKPEKAVDGLYSASKTLFSLKGSYPAALAAHKLFGYTNRSTVLNGIATTPENARWGRYTPIGLYAYKEAHGIPYSQWSIAEDDDINALCVMLGKGLAYPRKFCFQWDKILNKQTYDIIQARLENLVAPEVSDDDFDLISRVCYAKGNKK